MPDECRPSTEEDGGACLDMAGRQTQPAEANCRGLNKSAVQHHWKEVVEILTACLLEFLLAAGKVAPERGRIPLISGSQPAPLCADGGAEKPGPMHEEAKG